MATLALAPAWVSQNSQFFRPTTIWEEYSGDPQKLEDRINEIVFKYGIYTKDYPKLFN